MPATEQGVAVSRQRYKLIPRVLCFVLHQGEVLLLQGAPTKKIWPNRFNGLGGHVERGESIRAAAEREIREEAGLEVTGLTLRAVITIDTGEADGIGLFVFIAHSASRAVTPSVEGALHWVAPAALPTLPLVQDLFTLLPAVLSLPPTAPPLTGRYYYDSQDQWVVELDAPPQAGAESVL